MDSFFFSFCLVWLLWLELPILCWIKVARTGVLVVFFILEDMFSALQYWVRCSLWVSHIDHCYAEVCSLYTRFVESFHYKQMLNFFKSFPESIKMIIWFSYLLIWSISLICGTDQSCISGINLTWSWCIIEFCLLTFCWRFFASIFLSDIGLYFSYCVFVGIRWCWPHRDRRHSILCKFL